MPQGVCCEGPGVVPLSLVRSSGGVPRPHRTRMRTRCQAQSGVGTGGGAQMRLRLGYPHPAVPGSRGSLPRGLLEGTDDTWLCWNTKVASISLAATRVGSSWNTQSCECWGTCTPQPFRPEGSREQARAHCGVQAEMWGDCCQQPPGPWVQTPLPPPALTPARWSSWS